MRRILVFILLSFTLAFSQYSLGPMRGCTFMSLNGWHLLPGDTAPENYIWVFQHWKTTNPPVRTMLKNTFAAYQAANINIVRILLKPQMPGWVNHFNSEYPQPSQTSIFGVDSFIALAASYKIKTDIMFCAPDTNGYYKDLSPYPNDKKWIGNWMKQLSSNKNIGLFEIAAETCLDHTDSVGNYLIYPNNTWPSDGQQVNNYNWVSAMWTWFHSTYSNVPATFNILCSQGANDGCLNTSKMTTYASYLNSHFPGVAYASMEMYIYTQPSGAGSRTYYNIAYDLFSSYINIPGSKPPLFISEFGLPIGQPLLSYPNYTANDQSEYYSGVLAAASAFNGKVSMQFFCGSDDYPLYVGGWGGNIPNDSCYYGLFSGYDSNNKPKFRPAWSVVSTYFQNNLSTIITNDFSKELLLKQNQVPLY